MAGQIPHNHMNSRTLLVGIGNICNNSVSDSLYMVPRFYYIIIIIIIIIIIDVVVVIIVVGRFLCLHKLFL